MALRVFTYHLVINHEYIEFNEWLAQHIFVRLEKFVVKQLNGTLCFYLSLG